MECVKVLFVGNSYTYVNELWDIFTKICESEGKNVEVYQVTSGGYTLTQMASIEDEFGKEVDRILKEVKFSYVVLQEQSLRPVIKKELFFEAVKSLNEKIKENGANVILYETWGRKTGSPELKEFNLTNESMSKKLAESYQEAADSIGAKVAHVGRAFYDVTSNFNEIDLYHEDLSHPSAVGSYLSALVHFSTIFNVSPIGIKYKFNEDDKLQSILETAASKVIL